MEPILFALWIYATLTREQWRLVGPEGTVETVVGCPQLTAEQRERLQAAWVWSIVRPPRRVEPEAMGRETKAGGSEPSRLQVQVTRPSGPLTAAGPCLFAAPVAMWREVPEAYLPCWPIPADGRLSVPVSSGEPWRLRVAGSEEGSWWSEIPAGKRSVLLAAPAARGLRVRVLDPRGVPAVPVRASALEGSARQGTQHLWALSQGESGELRLPGLPDQDEVALLIAKPGFAPVWLRGRPSELPEVVRLEAGAVLTGRFVDEAGRPLAGAAVEVESWAAPEAVQLIRVRVKSTKDGSFRVAGIPPGAVFVSARTAGLAPFGERFEAAGGETDLGRLTLKRGRTLAVLAVDDLDQPVSGAEVQMAPGAKAQTDREGVAHLAGVAGDSPLRLEAHARGHLPGKLELSPPLPDQTRVVLRRALTVRGRFLETPARPATRGQLRAEQASCTTARELEADGRFEIDLPPAEKVTLVLTSPATREVRLALSPGDPGEDRDLGDLVAPVALSLGGRIVQDAEGSPVAGARIWVPRPGTGGTLFAWANRDLLEASSDDEGRFVLQGLGPGPSTLRVEAAGFARTHRDFMMPDEAGPGENGALDLGEIRLSAGSALRVTVAAPDAEPASLIARADLRGDWLEPDMLRAAVRDGEALFRNVPPGSVTVSVLAGRRLICERRVEVPPGGQEVDVDCGKAALTVAGIVRIGGAAAGPGVLLWQPPAVTPASRIDNVVSPGGLRQQVILGEGRPGVEVPVLQDGSFSSGDLTPGSWSVSWLLEAGSTSASQAVEIPAVERFETVITFPGFQAHGKVVDDRGEPVEGARVRDLKEGALAFSSADGRFSLTGLAPKVVLQAQKEGVLSDPVEIDLEKTPAAEPVTLALRPGAGTPIRVQVLDTAGRPVGGAFVFIEEEGLGQRLLTTAADGWAKAELQPPLPNRVRSAATTGSAWAFGKWTPWEQAREGTTLQAAAGGALRITSATAEGNPQIVTADGWALSWLLTQMGSPLQLTPDRPLVLGRLPAGIYTVSLGGAKGTATVREGETTELALEEPDSKKSTASRAPLP
jgi:hypothetical protein